MKWPTKKEIVTNLQREDSRYYDGYNAALEDCRNAWTDSQQELYRNAHHKGQQFVIENPGSFGLVKQPPALVPLNGDALRIMWFKINEKYFNRPDITTEYMWQELSEDIAKYSSPPPVQNGVTNELIAELKLLKSYFEGRREVVLHVNDIKWNVVDKFIGQG